MELQQGMTDTITQEAYSGWHVGVVKSAVTYLQERRRSMPGQYWQELDMCCEQGHSGWEAGIRKPATTHSLAEREKYGW